MYCSDCAAKDARIADLEQQLAEERLTSEDEATMRDKHFARIKELEAEIAGLHGIIRQTVNDLLAARAKADPRLRVWDVQFNLRDLRYLQSLIGMEPEPLTEAEIRVGEKLKAALDAARSEGKESV